ncbi:MAG: type II secretion system protein GspD [Thiobacillus sp.]|nr:type II secretion system protein GspD [Thiobacillus sp.]
MKTYIPKTGRTNRIAIPVLLAALIGGCATQPATDPSGGGNHEVVTAEEAKLVADTKAGTPVEDRYKLFYGTGVVVKPSETPPVIGDASGNLTLNFEGADLREVVRTILGDILRENYIVDPRVGGSITLRTARPIPRSAAMHTLEEVLRMNGAVMIREGDGVFRIVPAATAGKGNTTPQIAESGKPLPGGYSIQIVPLRHIGVVDMAKILEPLTGDTSSVRVDPLRNLLILSGTQLQLRHLIETVDMFDVDWISGMSVGLFTLQSVDVNTVNGELEKLFGDKNLGPLAGIARVVPLERLNALLIISPQPKLLDLARTWIERLDRPGAGGGGQRLYVYQVQNGKAENLAGLLNEAFSSSAKAAQVKVKTPPDLAPGATPAEVKSAKPAANSEKDAQFASLKIAYGTGESVGLPQDVRIIADKDNNALLILASPADYDNIESALRKLDVAVRQVLVEVTIAEVSLTDELTYGLEWYFNKGNGKGLLDTGAPGLTSLIPGFSYSWLSADYGAVLNALAKDSRLKIVSSPHITVADNQKAKIQVGDQVPTLSQTQSVEGSAVGIINSVQYTETGVLLDVTPRVNASGQVTMEISQEVSNATQTTTSDIDSPTIQKRTANSTVTVRSGETIILAGLIKEQKDNGNQGLPLLSKIPLIGGLFGTQTWKDNRTELIILITPHVLLSTPDAAAITKEYRKRLSGLESMLKSVELPPKPAAEKAQ